MDAMSHTDTYHTYRYTHAGTDAPVDAHAILVDFKHRKSSASSPPPPLSIPHIASPVPPTSASTCTRARTRARTHQRGFLDRSGAARHSG